MARAIWKGCLRIGDCDLTVKMFAAVTDRRIHFRLLHRTDRIPVRQEIVRKSDGKPVAKGDRRKAFPLEDGRAVILNTHELKAIGPDRSRELQLCRFVPTEAVSDLWYDRPYYLGPNGNVDRDYFALASTLEKKDIVGIVRWAMRGKRYVGALGADQGYLKVVTFRRAEQILPATTLKIPRPDVDPKELKLAQQLIDLVAADFEPSLWQDEYRQRVLALVDAKRRGKRVAAAPAPRKRNTGALADRLRRSLAGAREKKVA